MLSADDLVSQSNDFFEKPHGNAAPEHRYANTFCFWTREQRCTEHGDERGPRQEQDLKYERTNFDQQSISIRKEIRIMAMRYLENSLAMRPVLPGHNHQFSPLKPSGNTGWTMISISGMTLWNSSRLRGM